MNTTQLVLSGHDVAEAAQKAIKSIEEEMVQLDTETKKVEEKRRAWIERLPEILKGVDHLMDQKALELAKATYGTSYREPYGFLMFNVREVEYTEQELLDKGRKLLEGSVGYPYVVHGECLGGIEVDLDEVTEGLLYSPRVAWSGGEWCVPRSRSWDGESWVAIEEVLTDRVYLLTEDPTIHTRCRLDHQLSHLKKFATYRLVPVVHLSDEDYAKIRKHL